MRFGRLLVASMIRPYDHTIRIGEAGKASRRRGGPIGPLEKEAFARVEQTQIAEAWLGRRILFPWRPIGRRLRAETRSVAFLSASLRAAAALMPKGRLHRAWADAELLGDLPHAFSAARLVYSGADVLQVRGPADRAPSLIRVDAVIYPRFSRTLPIGAYRAAQGKGTKL
jgi:hypothetical protein